MRESLTNELYRRFPWTAPKPYENGGSTMQFGFEFMDGWYGLVEQLCDSIQKELYTHRGEEWVMEFCLLQAKEKFGALRFYVHPRGLVPESVHILIRLAELKSDATCEACGRPGKMRNRNGWYMVRCERCWQEETNFSTMRTVSDMEEFE